MLSCSETKSYNFPAYDLKLSHTTFPAYDLKLSHTT